jgi:hypothetical protein
MKKLSFMLCGIIALSGFVHTVSGSFDPSDRVVIYSHGFGEGEGRNNADSFKFLAERAKISTCKIDFVSVPVYPDAPAQIDKAVFYTQPAVITLANHLSLYVKSGAKSIVLVGRSCGAGTAINCLAKLSDFENNKEYFKGSSITNKKIAEDILAAINNGAFVATVPFLGVHKAKAIAISSALLSAVTCVGATALAYRYAPQMCDGLDNNVVQLGALWTGLLGYATFGDSIKRLNAKLICHTIIRMISNGHYNPFHIQPIDAVEQLRGKLTCPILLDFCKNDGVLENPDADTIKLYDALKGDNTHIILTDDGWHNCMPDSSRSMLESFNEYYFNDGKNNMEEWKTESQPSTEQLRQQIYPGNWITRIMRANKWAIGLVLFMSIFPLYSLGAK